MTLEYAVSAETCTTIRIPSASERFGIAGPGLFLRGQLPLWYPMDQMCATFTWVSIAVINSSRNIINRQYSSYARELARRGVTITGFDWLPAPSNWYQNLRDAIRFVADVGGRGFILDAEKAFINPDNADELPANAVQAQRYVDQARSFCNDYGLWLGFSSIRGPPRNTVVHTFCRGTDISIPQTYDRDHSLGRDPAYERRHGRIRDEVSGSAERYFAAGATRFAFGSGAYRLESDGSPRYRTATEIISHLETYPRFVESIIAWPHVGRVPDHIFEAYRQWWSRQRTTPLYTPFFRARLADRGERGREEPHSRRQA